MKKVLINYANERFERVRKINSWTGKYIAGFDRIIEYRPEDIDEGTQQEYKEILTYNRGNGLWLWKPYFIKKSLKKIEEGDYLFYLDSGAFFVRKITPLIDAMIEDIYVTDLPLIEEQWTKPLVLERLCQNQKEIMQSNQIQASFIMIKKSKFSIEFVDQWFELCCNKEFLLPEEGMNCKSNFKAHREDQSLLSILCKKNGIKPHKDPSQFGRFPEGYFLGSDVSFNIPTHADKYKPIIVLHRYDQIYRRALLKYVLICRLPYRLAKRIYNRKRRKV